METNVSRKTTAITRPLLLQYSKPTANLTVSVIVPVKDEAAHLVKTLGALRLQQDDLGFPLNPEIYEVLLLANNCSDHSFNVASQYQSLYPRFNLRVAEITLPEKIANIGTVRRLLMDEACQRLLSVGNTRGIIASTDGDSEVDPSWVFHIMAEIKNGNDAVGGRIVTKTLNDQSCRYYLENDQYRNLVARAESIADPLEYDPWPRHFQYFGASLAVTCEMYQRVGGLPQLPFLEDEALHKALMRKDARIRKSLKVKVITSNRQEGRVEIGFSQQLREWANMQKFSAPQVVASAEELILKFTCRQKLRKCWLASVSQEPCNLTELNVIADKLCINRKWLEKEFKNNKYFGSLWENVEANMYSGRWGKMWQPVNISEGIKGLTGYTERAFSN